MNLYAIYPRPNTSKKDRKNSIAPYLLNDLSITTPHQVWQVDIIYLRTEKGFMRLLKIKIKDQQQLSVKCSRVKSH